MTGIMEVVLACILGVDLFLAASSRLLSCIRWVAIQGFLLAMLPLVMWNWAGALPHGASILIAGCSLVLKGLLLPYLLTVAMRKANVNRELEPFVGYSGSLLIIVLAGGGLFWLCGQFAPLPPPASLLALPVAFITMVTGLFIIVARRKAITQVIGFLVFENGIGVFGTGMMLEHGVLVEMGVLLDILVLVFIMGITLFQISREFQHIDSDRLNQLDDSKMPVKSDITVEVEQ